MNRNHNLKQETNLNSNQTFEQLSELQMANKQDRRKNEILNGFVFLIGFVGFVVVFMLPRDGVYSNASLENSFSNSSPLASSSFSTSKTREIEKIVEIAAENLVKINGFFEAAEVLEFELENFQPNSEVVYTIHFGNGDSREVLDKITSYQYSNAGNYVVNVTAEYHEDTKQIFSENISIDEAILVNSEAFVELN
jgi:hypothetical protein